MRDLSYKPVFVGGPPASKYLARAEKMVDDLVRDGLKKDTWTEPGIIIIAKIVGSFKKVIFINFGMIFIFTKTVTFSNVVTIGGWGGGSMFDAVVHDFSDVPGIDDVTSIGYGWFLDGDSFVNLQAYGGSGVDNPPKFHAPITAHGSRIVIGEEDYLIDRTDGANPDAIFGRYSEYLRGPEKDYLYTTTGGQAIGDGNNPTLWEKDHLDETNTWKVSIQLSYPAPGGGTVFPVWVWDERFKIVPDGTFYIESSNGLTFSAWQYWKVVDGGLFFLLTLEDTDFGGSSLIRPGPLMNNSVNNDMAFVINEIYDFDGNVSDADIFYTALGAYMFEFNPSDYLDFTRTEDNKFRFCFPWMIEPDVYGLLIQNLAQPSLAADCAIDAIFKIDNTGVDLEVTVLWEAPKGSNLGNDHINPNNPKELVFGQVPMNGVSDAPEDHRVLFFDIDKPAPMEVQGTTGSSQLQGLTFVR